MFRSEVLSPIEIIRQATLVSAQVVQREGLLGVIQPGAFADLIVVEGDLLADPLGDKTKGHIPVVMKAYVLWGSDELIAVAVAPRPIRGKIT